MFKGSIAAGVALGLFIGAPSAAQTVATEPDMAIPAACTFSQPARVFTTLDSLPEVASELRRQGIEIADVGEPFVPFDITDKASEGFPHRQFVRAYAFKDRMIVWYYHGGLLTHVHVIEMRKQKGQFDTEAVWHLTGFKLSGPPCRATQALLDGVVGISDW